MKRGLIVGLLAIVLLVLSFSVFVSAENLPMWCAFHTMHTFYSDGSFTPDTVIGNLTANYDCGSTNDHDTSLNQTEWSDWINWSNANNSDGNFTLFFGAEWSGSQHIHYITLYPSATQQDAGDSQFNTVSELADWLQQNTSVAQYNHPARNSSGMNFSNSANYNETWIPLVEILNQGEWQWDYYWNCSSYAGASCQSYTNPKFPTPSQNVTGTGWVRYALNRGIHLGFSCGNDDHSPPFSNDCFTGLANPFNWTRLDIYNTLKARHTWAAENKTIMTLNVSNGTKTFTMGDIFVYSSLNPNITINYTINATKNNNITNVSLFYKGVIVNMTIFSGQQNVSGNFTQNLSGGAEQYLFIEAVQSNGQHAWTSPVWITYNDNTYPQFSNYSDNSGNFSVNGIGAFNVSVENTNGSVYLNIEGQQVTAKLLEGNIYNASYTFTSSGTYVYNWTSYGNGTTNSLNISNLRTFIVNASSRNISSCVSILESGTYLVTSAISDWGKTGACINVTVPDVELNCMGFENWIDGQNNASTYGVLINRTGKLGNITIKNCNITEFNQGIAFLSTQNSTIYNCTISRGYKGIQFSLSNKNNITNVTTNNNTLAGLFILSSLRNRIINFTAANSTNGGIMLEGSNLTHIANSTLENNEYFGISFLGANLNNLTGSIIQNNSAISISSGINISSVNDPSNPSRTCISANNSFWDNILNNTPNGGRNWIIEGQNYTNYFNSTKVEGTTNILGKNWSAGNYWSDYTGSDIGGDYIGDSVYLINETFMNDSLPLVYSVTVPATTPSSGGGGGGGGAAVSKTQTWDTAEAGTLTVKVNSAFIGVSEVVIQIANAVTKASVTVARLSLQPTGTNNLTKVYRYLQVETKNLTDAMSSGTLKISVEKAWLASSNITKENVAAMRWDTATNQWQPLSTAMTTEDNSYVYYDVTTPKFSYFAIAEKQIVAAGSEIQPPAGNESQQPQPQGGNQPSQPSGNQGAKPKFSIMSIVYIIAGFIAIILLIALPMIIMIRKKKISESRKHLQELMKETIEAMQNKDGSLTNYYYKKIKDAYKELTVEDKRAVHDKLIELEQEIEMLEKKGFFKQM